MDRGHDRVTDSPDVLRHILLTTAALSSEPDEATTLLRLAELAQAAIDADRVWLTMPQPPGPSLCVQSDRGQPARVLGTGGSPEGTLAVPVRIGTEIVAVLSVEPADPSAEDARPPLMDALTDAIGAALGNARRLEAARRREEGLTASIEVTHSLLGSRTDDTLQTAVEHARAVAHADVAWIAVSRGRDTIEISAVDGPGTRRWHGSVVPTALATAHREAIDTRRPVVVHETTADPLRSVRERFHLGPMVAVPLIAHGRPLGSLMICNSPGRAPFTDLDVELVSAFAANAALALEFEQVANARRRLALLEERNRIARDLHDVVIQQVFAIGMRLDSLRGYVPPATAAQLGSCAEDLDTVISELRRAIFSLRTTTDEASLRAQLIKVVDGSEATLGFRPHLRLEGPLDTVVGADIREHAVAVLMESLSNAAKHAGGTKVTVHACADHRDFVLTVTDNGRGLPSERRHSGLRNLADRAVELGGSSELRPGPDGSGLQVVWSVPLTP